MFPRPSNDNLATSELRTTRANSAVGYAVTECSSKQSTAMVNVKRGIEDRVIVKEISKEETMMFFGI